MNHNKIKMQFSSDNLCHFIKMRPTIQKINTSMTFTTSRNGGCFSGCDEKHQFRWKCCLICGNYTDSNTNSINIMCTNKEHLLFNYYENIKSEIEYLIKIIDYNDKYNDYENGKRNKQLLSSLSIKLATDYIIS
jgi:hypothetical protein